MTTLLRTPPGTYNATNAYRQQTVSTRKPPPPPPVEDKRLDSLRQNGAGSRFIGSIISIATQYHGSLTQIAIDAALSKWLSEGSHAERFRVKLIHALHTEYQYSVADLSRFLNMHKQTVRGILKEAKGPWGGRQ